MGVLGRVFLVLIICFYTGCSFGGKELPLENAPYVIKRGDSIASIAFKFGLRTTDIVSYNKITSPNELQIGKTIQIPISKKLRPQKEIVKRPKIITTEESTRVVERMHWPVPGARISSKFGWRLFSFHEGMDIAAPRGTPVEAAHDGTVIYTGQKLSGYGRMVLLQAVNVLTVYCHLAAYNVSIGDRVRAGQVVGFVGNSGEARGYHLHFETRMRDSAGKLIAVNPERFFK